MPEGETTPRRRPTRRRTKEETPSPQPETTAAGDQAPDSNAKPEDVKPERKPRATPKPPLEKSLNDAFGGVALAVGAMGDPYCAKIIATNGEAMAKAWADLAKVNPAVKRILEKMTEGSAWGAVIFTTMATAVPIAYHHGLYPKNVPPPFTFGLGPPPPPSEEVRQSGGDTPT